jgi:hypothetical protein
MRPAERQTRSILMSLFERNGFHPRTDLGQNFLIDMNLIEYILDQADLGHIPRLDRDQRRFGDVQVGNLIERRWRPVIVHAKVVQDA